MRNEIDNDSFDRDEDDETVQGPACAYCGQALDINDHCYYCGPCRAILDEENDEFEKW